MVNLGKPSRLLGSIWQKLHWWLNLIHRPWNSGPADQLFTPAQLCEGHRSLIIQFACTLWIWRSLIIMSLDIFCGKFRRSIVYLGHYSMWSGFCMGTMKIVSVFLALRWICLRWVSRSIIPVICRWWCSFGTIQTLPQTCRNEDDGLKISTSKSKAMVSSRKEWGALFIYGKRPWLWQRCLSILGTYSQVMDL